MSRKRKSTSALEGDEGEEEESLGSKLLRRMESKGDVTFLVGSEGEQEEIKASSFLLSTLSPVFDVMFNENWKQQNQKVIELPDIKPNIFRHFLKLLLSDKVKSEDLCELKLTIEEILHMLYVAKKYETESESITSICRAWLHENITTKNVLFIYTTLQNMDETKLEQEAFEFITKNIQALMEEESFLDLSEETLMAILEYDGLSIQELTLFKGVYRWAESKCASKNVEINGENIRAALGSVLFLLRFPVMTNRDFFKSVHPTGILSLEEINEIARCIAMRGDSPFINTSGFSSKARPNTTSDSSPLAPKPKPTTGYCFIYTPTQPRTINSVLVNSTCSTYSRSQQYNLKLRIFDGDTEILPMINASSLPGERLSFTFPKSITLTRGKSYSIHYEVLMNASTVFTHASISGWTILIKTVPYCC